MLVLCQGFDSSRLRRSLDGLVGPNEILFADLGTPDSNLLERFGEGRVAVVIEAECLGLKDLRDLLLGWFPDSLGSQRVMVFVSLPVGGTLSEARVFKVDVSGCETGFELFWRISIFCRDLPAQGELGVWQQMAEEEYLGNLVLCLASFGFAECEPEVGRLYVCRNDGLTVPLGIAYNDALEQTKAAVLGDSPLGAAKRIPSELIAAHLASARNEYDGDLKLTEPISICAPGSSEAAVEWCRSCMAVSNDVNLGTFLARKVSELANKVEELVLLPKAGLRTAIQGLEESLRTVAGTCSGAPFPSHSETLVEIEKTLRRALKPHDEAAVREQQSLYRWLMLAIGSVLCGLGAWAVTSAWWMFVLGLCACGGLALRSHWHWRKLRGLSARARRDAGSIIADFRARLSESAANWVALGLYSELARRLEAAKEAQCRLEALPPLECAWPSKGRWSVAVAKLPLPALSPLKALRNDFDVETLAAELRNALKALPQPGNPHEFTDLVLRERIEKAKGTLNEKDLPRVKPCREGQQVPYCRVVVPASLRDVLGVPAPGSPDRQIAANWNHSVLVQLVKEYPISDWIQ